MGVWRQSACSVCGVAVLVEPYAPRTYRVDDPFEPHYCSTTDVQARLRALAAAALAAEAAPVARPIVTKPAERPPEAPKQPQAVGVTEDPRYKGEM